MLFLIQYPMVPLLLLTVAFQINWHFARYRGFGTPEVLSEYSQKYRYAPLVFVTPPWPEIFVNDSIRTETFDEACQIHEVVVETYLSLNYQIIELPLLPPKQRTKYLLENLLNFENDAN